MDVAQLSPWFASTIELAKSRWRQLLIAVGVTAAVDGLLWILAKALLGHATGAFQGTDGPPAMLTVHGSFLLVWAVMVLLLVLPMAAATAALSSDEDEPALWLRDAAASVPAQWIRLALPTLPTLLLGMWVMQSLISYIKQAFSGGGLTEPAMPLALKVAQLLGHAPVRIALFTAIVGVWYLWSAIWSTRDDRRLLPSAPWQLHGAPPLAVGVAVLGTSLVLGPLLSKALDQFGSALGSAMSAQTAATDGGSTFLIVLLGAFIAAFIGAVAIPWIALFRDEDWSIDADVVQPHGGVTGAQTSSVAATATTMVAPASAATTPIATVVPAAASAEAHATQPVAAQPLAAPAAPAQQVSDQVVPAQPGEAAGAWWYVPAGGRVLVEVAAASGVPQAVVADAAGAWQTTEPGPHPGAAAFTAPADGWFLLGAWLTDETPQHVRIRLTLPAQAQPAPQAA